MFDYTADDLLWQGVIDWKPVYISYVDGVRVVRTIEDVEIPDKEELDKRLALMIDSVDE